ncbi:uncharacterized protein YALI1_C01590g [Yarrowia lipolytica]|uniref:Uncharacterized protein n=1 Tax=Yarrowia lipolytica TaxID=4952 RepID=A0A1D8N986_YARLL|nr:hypothetical protein YALI1_C01590g [Yarrowia lipolytica]
MGARSKACSERRRQKETKNQSRDSVTEPILFLTHTTKKTPSFSHDCSHDSSHDSPHTTHTHTHTLLVRYSTYPGSFDSNLRHTYQGKHRCQIKRTKKQYCEDGKGKAHALGTTLLSFHISRPYPGPYYPTRQKVSLAHYKCTSED